MLINNYNIDLTKFQQNNDGYWIRAYRKKEILFNETHRQCSECGNIKTFDKFYKSDSEFLNVQYKCIECHNKYHKDKIKNAKEEIIINNYVVDISKYKTKNNMFVRNSRGNEVLFSLSHKQCIRCNIIKSFDNFNKRKNAFINLSTMCKECNSIYEKKLSDKKRSELNKKGREYYSNNREKLKRARNESAKYDIDRIPLGYESRNKNDLLQVRCYKCKKWTFVTNTQLSTIISSQNKQRSGQNNIYCSDNCKRACSEYHNHSTNKELEAFNLEISLLDYELLLKNNIEHELIKLVINKAKERDDYTCQGCDCSNNLEGHHIKPIALCIGTDDEYLIYETDNIITLCRKCHMKEHVDELSFGKLKSRSNKISICLK